MRILFLSTDFPTPWQPGRAPFNLQLVRALKQKHDVRVIAPVAWVKRLARRKAPVRENAAHPTFFYPPKLGRSKFHVFYQQSIRAEVSRMLKDFSPHIVLSYWAHPDGAAAATIAKQCGAKSAVIVGGSDVLVLPRNPQRRRSVVNALQEVDHVFSVSDDLRRAVIELGIPAEKVSTARQGVDRNTFFAGDRTAARLRCGIPSAVLALLWVGRIESIKGLDVLLRAMPRILNRQRDARLYLLGSGSQQRALQLLASRLNLTDVVNFVGPVAIESMGDWYRAADLTVLPSRSEGLPNVLRESLACGTPFVASRVGSVHEIVQDNVSQLVAPENPEELAAAIVVAIENPAPRAAVNFHNWEDYAEQLVSTLLSQPQTQSNELLPEELVTA